MFNQNLLPLQFEHFQLISSLYFCSLVYFTFHSIIWFSLLVKARPFMALLYHLFLYCHLVCRVDTRFVSFLFFSTFLILFSFLPFQAVGRFNMFNYGVGTLGYFPGTPGYLLGYLLCPLEVG